MPRNNPIDQARWGVSFSLKQCRNFAVGSKETLNWLLHDAGFRRVRLMSYWDEHEQAPGKYDFSALDWQIAAVKKAGGVITLCLGARQPRWPENHWPDWAWALPKAERTAALLRYIEQVVERYRQETCIISYQLENEALLRAFGQRAEVDRSRLKTEYQLVKRLDPSRPIIMTTSTSWGIPLRRPIPDISGFSYYHTYYSGPQQRYKKAGGHYAAVHRLRAAAIQLLHQSPSFIHELQLEPWAPKAIWEVPPTEQDKSMGPDRVALSVARARRTGLYPIDLWGGEWWYWRLKHGDPSIWQAVQQALTKR